MEQLFRKYQNVQIFATKYRGYKLEKNEKLLNFESFKQQMQSNTYVKQVFTDKNNEPIEIYLFAPGSKYLSASADFVKLVDKAKEKHTVITITKDPLSVYIRKAIRDRNNLTLSNVPHKFFIMEISKGPLCSPHRILSVEETKNVCDDLKAHGHFLPAISVEDPQCFWLGAQVNDVIEIESVSDISGKAIRYRIVTPSAGKNSTEEQVEE